MSHTVIPTVSCQNQRASFFKPVSQFSFGIPSNVNGLKAIGFSIIMNKEPKREFIELNLFILSSLSSSILCLYILYLF